VDVDNALWLAVDDVSAAEAATVLDGDPVGGGTE
jgi:hypothetical protein